MVVGVVVFANNARDITTSVSLEDRLDNGGDFYRQNLLSRDDIVILVKNVELYFR